MTFTSPRSQTGFELVCSLLSSKQVTALQAVKAKSGELLDRNPRFKFFTLHGPEHLASLFEILGHFIRGGVSLHQDDLFTLSLAICTHDLGMVITLADKSGTDLLDGKPQDTEPALIEEFVRRTHHDLVELYYQHDFNFLTSLGISPQILGAVREVSRLHRVIPLADRQGTLRNLGALLRVIDELDLNASRAPYHILEALYPEMDSTSCWHWYKHNIVEGWAEAYTVESTKQNGKQSLVFKIQVHPATESSIPYWLNQISHPIRKALHDDGAQAIIKDKYGVSIEVKPDAAGSYINDFGVHWRAIEERALSSGRKLVLVIDDESRKLEDLFLPLMDTLHVTMADNAQDGFAKLKAKIPDLVIVDMQVPGGGRYTAAETEDFKATGLVMCRDLRAIYPQVKIIILTGTKHPLPPLDGINPDGLMIKPIDPQQLVDTVKRILT